MLDLQLQKFVYEQPSRIELLEYEPKSIHSIRVSVYRNHSFELIANTIAPYLDFAGYRAEFVYSDYDDSLSFVELDTTTDALILWLDLTRYKSKDLHDFLKNRISYLKTIYKKPVLSAFLGNDKMELGINSFPVQDIADSMQAAFWDIRMESFSGTKISVRGMLEISRQLGLKFIPAQIGPLLKTIVVDLDNTLYEGVLGEEGYNKIKLTDGHKALQMKLLELRQEGFFLCIVSKNDEQDVLEMFHKRHDFPLAVEDFSKLCCSWKSKSETIPEIARCLNVNTDSFLFLDDNPGELIEMETVFPEIKKILAYEDAKKTAYVLENYPGLHKTAYVFEDSIRNADTAANQCRQEMQKKLCLQDYIKSLNMKLVFSINVGEQISRISILANKTNQFIFNYKRYTETEVTDLMNRKDAVVVSAALSDNLSDSGIIAACVGECKNSVVEISELFVSCRALGRGIEDIIIRGAIQLVTEHFAVDSVCIKFQAGERNFPAKKYVDENLSIYTNSAEKWHYEYPKDVIEIVFRG